MIGLALRGMAERKLRSVLTTIAVLLGVSMIAGTYVLTDQIRGGFENLEESIYTGVDVEVAPKTEFTSQFSAAKPLDERLVDRVRAVPGVAKAEGDLYGLGGLVLDGKLKQSTGGGGTIVAASSEKPFKPADSVKGRLPQRSGEVAVVKATAENRGIHIGDRIGIANRRGVAQVTVVGTFELGDVSFGGTDLIWAKLDDIQRWFDREGQVTSINVAAADGVSPDQLVRRLQPLAPAGVEVRTGEKAADDTAADINAQIGGFLTPALLAFAGAALLVGAFIIFNTFTITVAERTREFAMLRTLGATRRQILGAVALEALVIGIGASLAGMALGLLFAKGVAALFESAGVGVPTSGLELAPRTIAVSLIVGVGITMVAAMSPARRATRVPPIAALQRSDQPVPSKHPRRAPIIATIVVVLGLGMLVAGLFASGPASSRLSLMALGVVLLFIGVALSSRWFVRPLAGAVGWPIERLFAEPGLLARENSMRNPARTATTAAALMVGLGLVVFVAVFANGIKASVDDTVARTVKSDLIVRSDNQMQPIPAEATAAVQQLPQIGAVSDVLIDQVKVDGKDSSSTTDIINGVNAFQIGEVYQIDWVRGNDSVLTALHGNNALIEEQFGKAHDLGVGDSYRIQTPSGGTAKMHVIGVYHDPQLAQGTIISRTQFNRISSARDPWVIFAEPVAGVPVATAKQAMDKALDPFPIATVDDRADYSQSITDRLNKLVYMLYALLAMSVIISLFGIANSLFLSIHERTREFGLLRAVGATRAQVRRMVRYESVITAVIGGLLGTAVGLVFAFLVTQSLGDLGLGFTVPAGQLLVFLLLAVMVGVVAAVVPARRGARLQVLDAMRAE
jgi:putative ABC transport system permease protein